MRCVCLQQLPGRNQAGLGNIRIKLKHWIKSDLEKSDRVIVIDAIKAQTIPGTVYRLCIERCNSPQDIDSVHNFDIFAVLALTGRNKPTEVIALGIEPAKLDWSTKLSPEVSKALPFLVESVKRELTGQQPYFQL